MSKISGSQKAYVKALSEFVEKFNPYDSGSLLFGIGYSLSDLPFFGYSEEDIEHETKLFNKVADAYEVFEAALNEAING